MRKIEYGSVNTKSKLDEIKYFKKWSKCEIGNIYYHRWKAFAECSHTLLLKNSQVKELT